PQRSIATCGALALLACFLLAGFGCGSGDSTPTVASIPSGDSGGDSSGGPAGGSPGTVTAPVQLSAAASEDFSPANVSPASTTEVVLKTTAGEIHIRLYPDKSPRTVDNFLDYVDRGYYAGTVFHHVEKGFLAAAGGYLPDGQVKDPWRPISNEANNGLKNVRGTVAMARYPESAHSATSQFFFNLADNDALDFKSADADDQFGYCVFGEVTSGWDVVEQIAGAAVGASGEFTHWPAEPVKIVAATRAAEAPPTESP
ncbi:MAG TPA: peptidylprolyl isomerase, partial [Pirellulaceae bacterium]|nr:peptidylprolyl isomerase [Pirellulaceae bacterium]